MPEPDSFHGARDRLSRIGALFLSDDCRRAVIALHAVPGPQTLRAIELASALASHGYPATLSGAGHGPPLQIRLLPCADSFIVTGKPKELRAGIHRHNMETTTQGIAEFVIIESTRTAHADTIPFVLLAVPADANGMRRAWIELKTIASGARPAIIGATITGVADIDEAEDCHARFAAAAERFLGIEVVSYACLLRDGQNREEELRNIAALLVADLATGPGAVKHEHID